MWPGPYGEWGSRKYLLASLDQSLARMGLDYVDIFYSHRFDPDTPLEETMGALDTAVRQGKALYAGISSYSPEKTREAAAILAELGTPLLIHQPSYSLLNRWIEDGAARHARRARRRLHRLLAARAGDAHGQVPRRDPRGLARRPATRRSRRRLLTEQTLAKIRRAERDRGAAAGRRLAQLALAWTLRDPRMTSTLIGASSVAQLEDSLRRARQARLLGATSWRRSTATRRTRDINIWVRSSAE